MSDEELPLDISCDSCSDSEDSEDSNITAERACIFMINIMNATFSENDGFFVRHDYDIPDPIPNKIEFMVFHTKECCLIFNFYPQELYIEILFISKCGTICGNKLLLNMDSIFDILKDYYVMDSETKHEAKMTIHRDESKLTFSKNPIKTEIQLNWLYLFKSGESWYNSKGYKERNYGKNKQLMDEFIGKQISEVYAENEFDLLFAYSSDAHSSHDASSHDALSHDASSHDASSHADSEHAELSRDDLQDDDLSLAYSSDAHSSHDASSHDASSHADSEHAELSRDDLQDDDLSLADLPRDSTIKTVFTLVCKILKTEKGKRECCKYIQLLDITITKFMDFLKLKSVNDFICTKFSELGFTPLTGGRKVRKRQATTRQYTKSTKSKKASKKRTKHRMKIVKKRKSKKAMKKRKRTKKHRK